MTNTFCLLLALALSNSVHAAPAWVESLTSGSIKFELLSEKNAEAYDFPTAGDRQTISPRTGALITLNFFSPSLFDGLMKIQKHRGKVVLDTAQFAQIAAIARRGELYERKGLLSSDYQDMSVVHLITGVELAHLTHDDDEVCRAIEASPLKYKDQWLVRLGPDEYLGINATGVHVQNQGAWAKEFRVAISQQLAQPGMKSSAVEKLIGYEREGRTKKLVLSAFQPGPEAPYSKFLKPKQSF